MSISQKISDIGAARDTIRTKLAPLGLVDATDKLSAIATKISTMPVHNAIDADVVEGGSFKIERGYHVGGTIRAISDSTGDANKYKLQPVQSIEPIPGADKTISPDEGYYGLASVIVKAIPSQYKDLTNQNIGAADVLSPKIFVDKVTGVPTAGTMPNIGAVEESLDRSVTSYTIPAGYHNGQGTVSITTEERDGSTAITPSTGVQTITPTTGKVLSKVVVNAIPAKYADVSKASVDPDELLTGTVAFGKNANGEAIQVDGAMPNNGTITASISGLDSSTNSYKIPKGYTSGGTITLTSDIEDLLASI